MIKAASMIGLLFAPCINLFATTSDQMSPTHRTGENYELRQQLGRLQQRLHETETELTQLRTENAHLRKQQQRLIQLAGMTPTGELVRSRHAMIEQWYDNHQDQTIVRSKPDEVTKIHGSRKFHSMTLGYSYPGREPTGPAPTLRWHIQSIFSGGAYQNEPQLRLRIDGEEVILAIVDYHRKKRQSSIAGRRRANRDDETLIMDVDKPLLDRISWAMEVQVAIKNIRFMLSRNQIASFEAMRERIELYWPEPTAAASGSDASTD